MVDLAGASQRRKPVLQRLTELRRVLGDAPLDAPYKQIDNEHRGRTRCRLQCAQFVPPTVPPPRCREHVMVRMHVDLGHRSDADDLVLEVHRRQFPLTRHSSQSLSAAGTGTSLLGAMPAESLQRFTHFVDVDGMLTAADDDRPHWVRVLRPATIGTQLPEVVLMALCLPERHLRAYARRAIASKSRPMAQLRAFDRADMAGRAQVYSGHLATLGVNGGLADAEALGDALVQAQTLVSPHTTAAALTAFHPELASADPYAATIVAHAHVYPDPKVDPDQFNAVEALAAAMKRVGTWSPVVDCTDKNGKPLTAGYAIDGLAEGQRLQTYGLQDDVQQLAVAATAGARRTASNDRLLATRTWHPGAGTATLGNESAGRPVAAAASSFKWVVDDVTQRHGISVDPASIRLDDKGVFSIDASNNYARTLYASYRLFDDAGSQIGDITKLRSITAVNSILGIPCPTDPTCLQFPLTDASSLEVRFGSLGISDWYDDVSLEGLLLTGLWQYGIPIVFMLAGKGVTSTSTFNKIVNDKDLTAAAIAIGIGIVGGAVPTAAALLNTKSVLFSFADIVIGLALQKGLEKLGEYLVEQAGEGAISAALGPVGWVMRLVAAGLNFELMAITTGESLSSPAGQSVRVSRAIDVALILAPDPKHGEAGNPDKAVWPAVASTYTVTLQLQQGGTTRQLTGTLSGTTDSTPLELRFADVPAGGKLRIIAGVYSANGWLAGTWQSEWLDAQASKGTTLDLGRKTITEKLVPLAGDTQYVFKERVQVEGGNFVWRAGEAPTATRSALDCGGAGALCDLVDITLNNSAQQAGYAWRASGQHLHPDRSDAPVSDDQLFAVQNLSVLADPGSRLKSTTVGLTDRPAMAYAPSTGGGTTIDETNFIVDPRGGGMHLRRVVLGDDNHDFGLGDPNLLSWGRFPLENVDAAAVRPDGTVVACSWQHQKLMILTPAPHGMPDNEAPLALMVSGDGIREGLLRGPRALASAPDGRILVLESLNRRVQSFDSQGNPVPSFTMPISLMDLPTGQLEGDLDSKVVPVALQNALQGAGMLKLGTVPASHAAELDSGHFVFDGPLLKALAAEGVSLAYDRDAMDDPGMSSQITVDTAGKAWSIRDPRGHSYRVDRADGVLGVHVDIRDSRVTVEQAGGRWLVVDRFRGGAWRLAVSSDDATMTHVRAALSFFPLRGMRTSKVTYIDMAVEAQGYVYVLSYQNDGSAAADYLLDIYAPDGRFVSRTPDPSTTKTPTNVVAGKMTVGMFRDLYGLTYETVKSPLGAPQPVLAHWTPTPPLFALPLDSQPHYAQKNISLVVNDFAAHGVTLSSDAFVSVDDPEGAWSVRDGQSVYHVYRSGDGLQVFAVPA